MKQNRLGCDFVESWNLWPNPKPKCPDSTSFCMRYGLPQPEINHKSKPMKPDLQRIAIARHMGWNVNKEQLGGVFIYRDNKGRMQATLPDYLNDLNAMHEAEKVLRQNQFHYVDFPHELFKVITGKKWDGDMGYFFFSITNATAAQRAEAFLRTIGKWVEE